MQTYDLGVQSSMEYISNNDFDPSELGLTFGFIEGSQIGENFGNQKINNKNKELFIQMLLNYYGFQKSREAIKEFLKGLYLVVPQKLLNLLEIEDLENLLVGQSQIDLEDWKLHTNYVNRNYANLHIVEWYWSYLETLNQSQIRKWLQFCTGCQSVPINGFASLSNNRQER